MKRNRVTFIFLPIALLTLTAAFLIILQPDGIDRFLPQFAQNGTTSKNTSNNPQIGFNLNPENDPNDKSTGPNYRSSLHSVEFNHPGIWGELLATSQPSTCKNDDNKSGYSETVAFTLRQILILIYPCGSAGGGTNLSDQYSVIAETGQVFDVKIYQANTLPDANPLANSYTIEATYQYRQNADYTDIYIEYKNIAFAQLESAKAEMNQLLTNFELRR